MTDKNDLPACPVAILLKLIGNKWKILIIRDLLSGTKRFGELQRSIGCSQKVLTDNLRELESKKLLIRKIYPALQKMPRLLPYSIYYRLLLKISCAF